MPNDNNVVKICPFMSTPEKAIPCTPNCKLYRANRKNYECHFQEMQAISWNTKGNAPPQNYNANGGSVPPGY